MEKSLNQEADAPSAAGAEGAQDDTDQNITASNTAEMDAMITAAGAQNMTVEPASRQVPEKDSEEADKQAPNAGDTGNNNNAAQTAQTPPPIFCAPAPIKPTPGNYEDKEDPNVVRKSARLPTAKRVRKYGGVNYNYVVSILVSANQVNVTATGTADDNNDVIARGTRAISVGNGISAFSPMGAIDPTLPKFDSTFH